MGGPPNHHHPQHHQSQPQPPHGPGKEDPGIQLHDEADLISFRTDALVRYISNHEYIENVTSKLIHTSKIIPPSLYPIIPKISDYENLKPEDIYFGDLSAMKYVENKLMNRLEAMKDITNNENVRYLVDSESYNFQKESQKKLAGLQRNLTDKESVTALEQELDKVLSEYNAKFKQNYKVVPAVHQYSISVDKLAPNLDVTSAPENYNPKSINSFININNDSNNSNNSNGVNNNNNGTVAGNENTLAHNDNGAGSFGNDDLSSFQFGNNIDTSKFNGFNGISMNQFDSNFLSINGSSNTNENNSDRDQTNNSTNGISNTNSAFNVDSHHSPSLPPQDLGSNENSNNITTNNSDSNINTNTSNNDNNSLQNEDDGDDNVDNDDDVNIKSDQDSQNRSDNGLDMNDLFNDDGRGDMDHSAIVNDDMGDLYDFETGGNGGDDDELMGGTEFEQDFLNQIDHSME
ncbi:hypothetical protein G210_2062, partial [Candida maltosa Xu316]